MSPDYGALAEEMIRAQTPDARFGLLSGALAARGFDQVNYGFFDPEAAAREEAQVIFLSTMSGEWLDYYYDRELHLSDPLVRQIRHRNLMPYQWGERMSSRIEETAVKAASDLIFEAGLKSALCVPLTGVFSPDRPVAGMTIGTSLRESEFERQVGDDVMPLLALTHLFHDLSIGALMRQKVGASPLTARERDCLQYIAHGLRQDAVAHKLGLSRVTVEMHLRKAREKLKAQSLPQAVARGLQFGEIEP
ncbi:MAG: LuxR C-terminal-related transcriptional regulator [Asticcacaulis sp.]